MLKGLLLLKRYKFNHYSLQPITLSKRYFESCSHCSKFSKDWRLKVYGREVVVVGVGGGGV